MKPERLSACWPTMMRSSSQASRAQLQKGDTQQSAEAEAIRRPLRLARLLMRNISIFITDVEGVMTADPRMVEKAKPLPVDYVYGNL